MSRGNFRHNHKKNRNQRPHRNDQRRQGQGRDDNRQQGSHGQHRRDQQNGAQAPQQPLNYGRVIESHTPKRYAYVVYDTFAQAKADVAQIAEKAKACDQLNIVIKAEGDMKDPELRAFGIVYAGAAWHLIHTRRLEEGWYNEPR